MNSEMIMRLLSKVMGNVAGDGSEVTRTGVKYLQIPMIADLLSPIYKHTLATR